MCTWPHYQSVAGPSSREVVQMKKRAWRWAGKPAMRQHQSPDTLGTAPLKESICQTCLRRGPPGSTLLAEASAGIAPLTSSHIRSPGSPPKVLPAVSGDRPPVCTHSIGSLIKQPPPWGRGHAPALWTSLFPANGPAGRGLCLHLTPSHPSTCQTRQCEEGWRALTV